MNVSFDDTDPFLQYSPDWRVQNPSDPNLPLYWQSTYHACQVPGCTFSLTFQGAGVYVYGSNGPNHGNFSINVADRFILGSAFSTNPRYQQLLYGTPLKDAQYTVIFNNTSTEPAWLDIDFFFLTQPVNVSESADPGFYSSTVPPLAGGLQSSASPTSSPTSTSSNNTPLLALSIAFGSLLGIFVLIGVTWLLLTRRAKSRRKPSSPQISPAPHGRSTSISVYPPRAFYSHGNSPVERAADDPALASELASVMYIGASGQPSLVNAPARSSSRASALTHLTGFERVFVGGQDDSVTSAAISLEAMPVPRPHTPQSAASTGSRGAKGKAWKAGHAWKRGAESIRTFVHVMDEDAVR